MSLPVEQLAQMMQLPDSWVILEVKNGNNEMLISVKPKDTSRLDESKTEVLRHLEFFGNRVYVKFYFSNEEDLDKLPLYTKTGFCKPFVEDVRKMFGRSTDKSICHLYSLTTEELDKIKGEYKTILA